MEYRQLTNISSDEDSSPEMQFTRSVRRTSKKPLASPSDSENTPTTVRPVVQPNQQQPSAACGYVRQQLSFNTPEPGASVQQPLKGQQPASGLLKTHTPRQHASIYGQHNAHYTAVEFSARSPATPATAKLPALDLNDPYTPWLRTSSKQPLPIPGAGAAAAAGSQELSCSPISSTSSSNASSPGLSTAPVPAALDSLCAAVADLQLKQAQAAATTSRALGVHGTAGAADSIAAVPAADPDSCPMQRIPPDAAVRRPYASAAAAANCGASSDEDDAAPLTLGRRTQPRVYRRPMLTADTDSSGNESGDEASSSSSSDEDEGHKHGGSDSCCAAAGAHRRITPGSTSSLVARRRPSSSGKLQPQPTDTGYTGAYDFDAHLSTIKPPKWQLQQRQHYMEQTSMTVGALGRSRLGNSSPRSPYSASPKSPVAALFFTPAHRGKATGAAAAAAAAASSPEAGARRLSGQFLGQGMSHPAVKQQPGFITPSATSRRRGHTVQADSKAAAARGPPTASKGTAGQDFGKVLEPLTEDSADRDSDGGSLGSSLQPGELVLSRRRNREQGGAVGKSAAAACATAPPKASSSRTFARQRQQLTQELYAQWNVQVFDSRLPADLALVWNPRLTATAGQVVDDGSRNHLKSSRDQRIPIRLELSSKVIDSEARLRTTLSHEMCHVAAWVISKEWKEHHGAVFWAWARRFEKQVHGIKITTCHNFDVHAPFRWQCSNHSCGKLYVRHKRSIDTNKHVCSRCQGRLLYLGKFSRDGKLIANSTSEAAAGSATPGGGNAFTMFVKTHFADVKRALPTGTPHKEVMTRLAAQYKEQKAATAAATPAAVALPRPGRTVAVPPVTTSTAAAEVTVSVALTPAVQRPPRGPGDRDAAAAAALVAAAAESPAAGSSDDEGWQTAEEEVEEQTSSLLSFMDRLALS